jgi:heat shock protein HtpX
MALLRLRLIAIGTLALIITVSTLFFTVVLSLVGAFNILTLASLAIAFNLVQWLLAPKMINALYKAREVSRSDNPKLYGMVEMLSQKIGLRMPKVMVANIPIPNAFAYSSPIGGGNVAVTSALLDELEDEEVEAVIGHELGHLKHRDVQIMMFASILPAVFYLIGYSMMLSGMFRGDDEGGAGGAMIIGLACMAMYWVLTLLVLGLSRQREYYADRRSAMNVEDGGRKLSEALAKIVDSTSRRRLHRRPREAKSGTLDCFKTLFIADPDRATEDEVEISRAGAHKTDQQLVNEILSRKLTAADRLIELLSTHPNIVKRLMAMQKF